MHDAGEQDRLTQHVRRLLGVILHGYGPTGRDQLLGQASSITLVGGPVTMLDLAVVAGTPAAAVPDGPLPGRAFVSGDNGEPMGELLVWLQDGYLRTLEFVWWSDEIPNRLPDPDRVSITNS